jgi:hypothetical protein
MAARRARSSVTRRWANLPDEELLDWRLCDLGLEIETCDVVPRLQQLDAELSYRGLRFRPYAWLSTEWFTPGGTTGFAVPFYLAHPRLARLERSQMLQVEGGSRVECMKILRHETAHALDNAYHLRRRRRWRETFGASGVPYRPSYKPNPNSRAFVQHLDFWYSQSHPIEDWAETFAVWLQPGSRWRARHAGWPALKKLQYVDELMAEIAPSRPAVRTRSREESLPSLRTTLREHYARKHAVYEVEGNPAFDGQLTRVFPRGAEAPGKPSAAAFLRRRRTDLVRHVAAVTGQHRYLLDHIVREMVARSKSRDLRVRTADSVSFSEAAVLLASLSTRFLHGAHPLYRR